MKIETENKYMRLAKTEIENVLGRNLTEEEYKIIFWIAFLKGENFGLIRLAEELKANK